MPTFRTYQSSLHGREVEETSLAQAQGTTANLKTEGERIWAETCPPAPNTLRVCSVQERRLKILRISTLAVAVAWLSVRICACFQMSPCCVFIRFCCLVADSCTLLDFSEGTLAGKECGLVKRFGLPKHEVFGGQKFILKVLFPSEAFLRGMEGSCS